MSPETSDNELILILLERHGSPEAIYGKAKAVAGVRVGRPADARRVCISVLIDIVRERRVSHPGEKLNQYQLMKRAEETLLHNGIKVGSAQDADKDLDRTTLREATRRVLLLYCEENIENYTANDWKWVKRNCGEAGRQKLKAFTDCSIEPMRGHIRQRSKGSWTLVLDIGRKVDPVTGLLKRVQKWRTFRGTKKEAQAELSTMLHNLGRGQVISPSQMILGEWLEEWLTSAIQPHKRLRTYETYRSVIERHLKPSLGQYRLCDLRASHLQAYYQSEKLAPATLQQHHTILHSALKAATMQDLVPRNAASLVIGKPRRREGHEHSQENCWEPEDARKFLDTAKADSPRAAALYSLALDSGARKAELCGLKWSEVDMERQSISIVRQLVKVRDEPLFGPPKNGKSRTILLDEMTIQFLRKHKAVQAAQKLQLGTAYNDYGLVFARDFGHPLTLNNIGQREFARLIKLAGVKTITFHGLRHTCATLAKGRGASEGRVRTIRS